MIVIIKGAGDIASGVAFRLFHAGIKVIMTDLPAPTCIRRTVCYSEAIVNGSVDLEGITAVKANNSKEALEIINAGKIAVLADEKAECIQEIKPYAVVDCILAKRNLGTEIYDAPIVIGVGPGFTAGKDCHAVIESMRGHTLGRIYYSGTALPNTGIPGNIGGFSKERVMHSPCAGIFKGVHQIGDYVEADEVCAYIDSTPLKAKISGILRGILRDGTIVFEGMKSGDVDPRCEKSNCYSISDKALSIGSSVLVALTHLFNERTGKSCYEM